MKACDGVLLVDGNSWKCEKCGKSGPLNEGYWHYPMVDGKMFMIIFIISGICTFLALFGVMSMIMRWV